MKLPDPAPRLCETISPTLANDILECPYRVAWKLDPNYRHLRKPTPRSELGRISHAVVEEIGKGLLSDVDPSSAENRVERRWNFHLDESVRSLENAWKPSRPPDPQDWPGYYLTKTRVIRRAMRLLQRADLAPMKSAGSSVERLLHDPESGVSGRPDRVEQQQGELCVVDLKTGLGQAEPTSKQRRQLLIYAFLVFKTSARWPTHIAIENASGRRWQERVKVDEAIHLVSTISEARTRFNEGAGSKAPSQMARPDANTCRWCAYRAVCDPYWKALTMDWDHGSVAGQVDAIESVGVAAILIGISPESPVDSADSWTVTGLPAATATGMEVGTSVTITGAGTTETSRFLKARWSTLLAYY